MSMFLLFDDIRSTVPNYVKHHYCSLTATINISLGKDMRRNNVE